MAAGEMRIEMIGSVRAGLYCVMHAILILITMS